MKEAELQKNIIDTAHLFGWHVAHFRPAQNSRGQWRTPVAADGKGFPDLVMVSESMVAFIEVKSARGRPTPEQKEWLGRFSRVADGRKIYVDVWKPDMWMSGEIERFLATNS